MDRETDDLPAQESMRVNNAAVRRNPLSDDKRSSRRATKKEALVLPSQKHSSYTSPGYYIVDRYGSAQEGPFDTYSLAIANLNGRDGIQFMDQAETAPLTEPFPPGMNTVFGSLKAESGRAYHGERAACRACDADIEFHSGHGWIDRGGNRSCDESRSGGYTPMESQGGPGPDEPLHRKHAPYREASLYVAKGDPDDARDEKIDDHQSGLHRESVDRHCPMCNKTTTAGVRLSDEHISDAYERHLKWSQENGYEDPETVKALRAHEKAKGITRREADGIADLTYIGGGDTDWRSQGHRDHIGSLTHTQESNMSKYTEADLLYAMANAKPSEAKLIMAEIEGMRRQARLERQAASEIDLANAVIREVLTPVATYSRHTAATDWLDEVSAVSEGVNNDMLTQAALWYQKVSPEVKSDREEFLIQAQGVARREASKHGAEANDAYELFMDHVTQIHGVNHTANNETLLPWSSVVPPLPPSTALGDNYNTNVNPAPGNPGQPQPLSNDAEHAFLFEPDSPSTPEAMGQASGPMGANFYPNQDATNEPNDDGALSGTLRGPGNSVTGAQHVAVEPGENPFPSWPIGGGQVEPVPYPINDPNAVASASSRENLAFYPNQDATDEPNDDGADNYDTGGVLSVGGSLKTASPRFTYDHQSYDEYLQRISAGSAKVPREFWSGMAAASSPTAAQGNTHTGGGTGGGKLAGGGMAPSRLDGAPQSMDDPTGAHLGDNPAAWGPFPEDPHSDQVMKQWGGTSSLPLAPTPGFGSNAVAENWSNLSDFPDTGPAEVPSSRAPNLAPGSGGDTKAASRLAFKPDDDENMKRPEGTQTGGRGESPGNFQPDQGLKAQSPQGQADADAEYENAYSSGRPINWTDTGENVLGTVPVEGYEYNADHPHGEMWPFVDHAPGSDAANVAGVPAPGVQTGVGWPQPQVSPKNAQLAVFRSRVHGQ